jgi:hypothetical protein
MIKEAIENDDAVTSGSIVQGMVIHTVNYNFINKNFY